MRYLTLIRNFIRFVVLVPIFYFFLYALPLVQIDNSPTYHFITNYLSIPYLLLLIAFAFYLSFFKLARKVF